MGFRIVPKSTEKIDMGDGDFIEVRKGLSKANFREILAALPEDFNDDNKSFSPKEADNFTVGIFSALVVGWSAVDEDGTPIPATVESYLNRLDRETAQAVDTALFDYFNSLSLTEQEKSPSNEDGE